MQSNAVSAKDGDQYSVIASFCPKFESIEHKPLVLKILVDCSGSMAGDSISSARRALHQVLQELGDQDVISYSKFGDKVQHTYRKMQKCTPTYIKEFSKKILFQNKKLKNFLKFISCIFRNIIYINIA
jgi:Ca-activated chloride channel family protein